MRHGAHHIYNPPSHPHSSPRVLVCTQLTPAMSHQDCELHPEIRMFDFWRESFLYSVKIVVFRCGVSSSSARMLAEYFQTGL